MGGFNPCLDWRLANLALQHQLGLLPQWRSGLDPDYPACPCADWEIEVSEKTEAQIDQAGLNPQTATDTLHSPEQNARFILEIFVHHFKLHTGESLSTTKLSGIWYDKQKSEEDLVIGLAYAKAHDWVTGLDEAFGLTEVGYRAATHDPV